MKIAQTKKKTKKLLFPKYTETFNYSDSEHSSSLNSFLIEIDYNSEIDEEIRAEINSRYSKSIVNPTYKFPRIQNKHLPIISTPNKLKLKKYKLDLSWKKNQKGINLQSKQYRNSPSPELD